MSDHIIVRAIATLEEILYEIAGDSATKALKPGLRAWLELTYETGKKDAYLEMIYGTKEMLDKLEKV